MPLQVTSVCKGPVTVQTVLQVLHTDQRLFPSFFPHFLLFLLTVTIDKPPNRFHHLLLSLPYREVHHYPQQPFLTSCCGCSACRATPLTLNLDKSFETCRSEPRLEMMDLARDSKLAGTLEPVLEEASM